MEKLEKGDIVQQTLYARIGHNQEIVANIPVNKEKQAIFGGKYLIDNGKGGAGLFPITASTIEEAFEKFDESFKFFASELERIYKEELAKKKLEEKPVEEKNVVLENKASMEGKKPAGKIIEFKPE